MQVLVKSTSRTYKVPVEVIEHDCYELMDYTIEEFNYYRPSQEEIDRGTDRDEAGLIAVCNFCGKDMPEVDVWGGVEG